ncbi:hypothetical protein FRZ67_10395 [Panacibacter ginsenosidivorans]|uniref:6-bladed beta-propeller n=1 Tax=Panacibacter ginsenosidivorans TaxID=1813871 RepID=A0A5B8V9Z4_9BACT|nr:hypothetical protein [Panacibacter ginsenosidivorans]QEC67681.1 hypothetical protein FRZ67_10395 [Panacibacter ginsenosidivorans]
MGRVISLYFLVLILQPVFTSGQDTAFHLIKQKTISGSFKDFYTDNFGNIFLISANNQIKKLDQHFDSVGIFNDVRRYGDVYMVDVNNPLKMVIYYRDFTTILVLDRFLNIRNTIDLRSAGILQARAVAQSYDNNYWVFDELNSKIKKIDDNGNVLLESADFRVLFSYAYNPQQIIDADGTLYLYDVKKGWLIFDYYGAYKKHIDVPGWNDVKASGNTLSGFVNNYFYTINPETFSERKANLGISNATKIQQVSDKLYVLTKNELSQYRIQ